MPAGDGTSLRASPRTADPETTDAEPRDPVTRELAAHFLDELANRLDSIHEALAARDADRLRRLAHELAGTAGGYGFEPVGEAARALEGRLRSARQETRVADRAASLDVEASLAELDAAVRDLIATSDAALRSRDALRTDAARPEARP